jgi:DNA-binding MarR family transcriptional regulator
MNLEVFQSIDARSRISGFILERTAKRMKQAFQQELLQANQHITVDQWVVLQELASEDKQTQQAIAEAIFKDPPTLTRIIDRLCEKGLIRRELDSRDRRRFRIGLTDAGRDKIEAVKPLLVQFRKKAWAGLSEQEIRQLVSSLNKVFENLK